MKIWRVGDGALIQTIISHSGPTYGVAFHPDGHMIASGGAEYTINLWNMGQGRGTGRVVLLRSLTGHTDEITNVAFSPDGKLLASASRDQTIKFWSIPQQGGAMDVTCLGTLAGHTETVNSVAFSPDGQLLASASDDQTVKIWKVADGTLTLVRTLHAHKEVVSSVLFRPDGALLVSAGHDQTIMFWRVSELLMADEQREVKPVEVLEGHNSGILTLAFSPDGQTLASSSWDNTIKLWRIGDEQGLREVGAKESQLENKPPIVSLMHTLDGQCDEVACLSFSPDGKTLVSGSWDNSVNVWSRVR